MGRAACVAYQHFPGLTFIALSTRPVSLYGKGSQFRKDAKPVEDEGELTIAIFANV